MKALGVTTILLLASGATRADPGDEQCVAWAQQIAKGEAGACADLCPQAKEFDHYDYRPGLQAALESRQGLDGFLAYLDRSTIIGAGAEAHACSVQALLLHWGDRQFAAALAKQSVQAREQAIGLLDYTAVANFQARFPRTYKLAAHE
jgi:hypothetical protein